MPTQRYKTDTLQWAQTISNRSHLFSLTVCVVLFVHYSNGCQDHNGRMAQNPETLTIDAFIAHSSKDKVIASKLKTDLEKRFFEKESRNFKIWIYEDDITPGKCLPIALDEAIYASRRFIMLMSPNLLETDYYGMEHASARMKENAGGIVTRIPVLLNMKAEQLPPSLQHLIYMNYEDSDEFINKLVTQLSNDVPLTSEIEVNRTGVGLAWSYYYGYLDIILPDLPARIQSSEFKDAYPKFITIMTMSCDSPGDISKVDPNFQYVGNIKHSVSRAGNIARDYSHTVYKFTYRPPRSDDAASEAKSADQTEAKEETYHLLMEFATPLLSLYKMQKGGLAKLDENSMWVERYKFKQVVEQILNYPEMNACKGKCLIIDYRDIDVTSTTTVLKKTTLSEAVWNAIQEDIHLGKRAKDLAASQLVNKISLDTK